MQDDRDIEELKALAKRSADGVIHFNPQLFDRYAAGRRRPYSLIFFLTAAHLQDKSSLGLRALRKQYGLLAKVYRFPVQPFHHHTVSICNEQQKCIVVFNARYEAQPWSAVMRVIAMLRLHWCANAGGPDIKEGRRQGLLCDIGV